MRKTRKMRSESLASNTFILTIGTFLNKGLQFLMIPLFSAWLDTASYGKFDVYCAYISLFTPIVTLSVQEGVFRFSIEAKQNQEKKMYITNGLVICLLNFSLLSMGLMFFNITIGHSEIMIPFIIYFMAEAFALYLRGVLRAIRRLDIYSYCSPIVSTCIFAVTFILVYKLKMQLVGILLGYGIGTLIGDIIMCLAIKFRKMIQLRYINYKIAKNLLKYSSPLILNDISWWVINTSDREIIDIFLGPESNGIYALAYKLPNLCTSIFSMFSLAWQQEAVKIINGDDKNEKFNEVLAKLLTTVISICILITSSGFILFDYIFDARYHEGIWYAPLLILSVMFTVITQYLGGILISMRNSKESGVSTVIGAVSNIVIHLMLVKIIGLWAAVWSTVLSNLIVVVIRFIRIRKHIAFHIDRKNVFLFMIYLIITLIATANSTTVLKWALLGCSVLFVGIVNYNMILRLVLRKR